MPDIRLPDCLCKPRRDNSRSCPAHRAWVRRHHCSVADCKRLPIECAHVRGGTDGGIALKPSDRWCVSLCSYHHQEQHRLGQRRFESKYDVDLVELAQTFARRSPHWRKLRALPDHRIAISLKKLLGDGEKSFGQKRTGCGSTRSSGAYKHLDYFRASRHDELGEALMGPLTDAKLAVIGLGYVGLPLAVAFARKYQVIGFDVSSERVEALRRGADWTHEVDSEDLAKANLEITDNASHLSGCKLFIVTVPTPIDRANRPDFRAVLSACELIGPSLSKGSIVVFESTVYPGVTEEICAPALEGASGLLAGVDFKLGYSPERINPGDKNHPLEKITKVVAGQDESTLDLLSELYGSIIEAGIHRATSIKVAEAAKVLENTQRDVNIALMNEVSKICDLVGIRSSEVLAAAATKWNFLRFHPGLVGGHCIGVDPYYLTAKAEQLGYHPQVILSGRRINDGMGAYVAQKVVKLLAKSKLPTTSPRVGILGITFKENVPDTRNSKVVDVYNELLDFGISPVVHDPIADPNSVLKDHGIKISRIEEFRQLHVLILAVPHTEYTEIIPSLMKHMVVPDGIFIDIKAMININSIPSNIRYWSL